MKPIRKAEIIPIRIPKKFKSYPNSLNKSMKILTKPLNIPKNLLVKLKIKSNPANRIPPAREERTCWKPTTTLFILELGNNSI